MINYRKEKGESFLMYDSVQINIKGFLRYLIVYLVYDIGFGKVCKVVINLKLSYF